MSNNMSAARAIKCEAKSKQNNHKPCRQPVIKGKNRCRFHGGLSTGPRTTEGKQRAATANYKHGRYTNDAIMERKMMQEMLQWHNDLDTDF